jgi:4-hydroxyphenylpyruvate dioxygenase
MPHEMNRESVTEGPNPLGLAGIEFIEYRCSRPQALGQVLEEMGFRPVARHRSREVLLYRQGDMNVVVNAHGLLPDVDETPGIAALALRVHDAGAAWQRCVDRGAWPVPVQVRPMELHIPAIHAVGASRIHFVDRWTDFSIYTVDFVPIPTVEPTVPATAGLHWFGIVQYVGLDRIADWVAFYAEMLDFRPLPAESRFGILPAGRVLASPCGSFFLQLIEPPPDQESADPECWQRVALGAPDVSSAVRALQARGVGFVDTGDLRPDARGALTQPMFGGVVFELVARG